MSRLDPLARIMTMTSKGHPGRPGKNQTMERRLKRVEREATAAVLAYDLPGQEPVGVYAQLPDADADYVGHIALVRGEAGQPGGVYIGNQDALDSPFWMPLAAQSDIISFGFQGLIGSSGSGDGQLDFPIGIASNGRRVWVGDAANDRVSAFDINGTWLANYKPTATTFDSSGPMTWDAVNRRVGVRGTDVPSVHGFQVWPEDFSTRVFQVSANGTGNGQFNNAEGIAADSAGNWFVVDRVNNRVQKFNSAGVYQSQFGSAGSGNGQFDAPFGIAIDAQDNIHVADDGNKRIQKFNASGTFLLSYGSQGNGPGQFLGIQGGLAVNKALGLVFVSDPGQGYVSVFDTNGAYLTRFGATSGQGGTNNVYGVASIENFVFITSAANDQCYFWRITAGALDDTGLYIPFLQRTRLVDVAADYEWTNQPLALTEMGTIRTRRKVDLSRYRDIRFMLEVNQAGVAGSDLLLRYSLDASSWTTITGTTLAINSTGAKDSGWVSLPAAARDTVFLAVWGQDGNATADPQFNWIVAQVR